MRLTNQGQLLTKKSNSASERAQELLRMIAYLRLIDAATKMNALRFVCSYHGRGIVLEKGYWLRRKRAELALAEVATSAEARLIHFDLAGRYSVKASNATIKPSADTEFTLTDQS